MSVGPVSPTALSFRAPSSLPVIPCGVFLANGHGLRPPFGRISAVDARSFLRRNGHGLRPPSGRISAVDARGLSPQTPLHQPAFPACVPKRGTGFFCCGHPRTEERSQRACPLRPCSDTARSACMDTPPSRGPIGHSHCILHRPRLPCSPDSRPDRGNARRQPRCPKTGPPYATG